MLSEIALYALSLVTHANPPPHSNAAAENILRIDRRPLI